MDRWSTAEKSFTCETCGAVSGIVGNFRNRAASASIYIWYTVCTVPGTVALLYCTVIRIVVSYSMYRMYAFRVWPIQTSKRAGSDFAYASIIVLSSTDLLTL